jgi:hypothetical protein
LDIDAELKDYKKPEMVKKVEVKQVRPPPVIESKALIKEKVVEPAPV